MKVATGEEFDVMRRYWQSAEGRAQLVPSYDEGTTIQSHYTGSYRSLERNSMRDSVRGASSDAWPAVHSPQLTVTLTVSFNFFELSELWIM